MKKEKKLQLLAWTVFFRCNIKRIHYYKWQRTKHTLITNSSGVSRIAVCLRIQVNPIRCLKKNVSDFLIAMNITQRQDYHIITQ